MPAFMDALRQVQGDALEGLGFGPTECGYHVIASGRFGTLREWARLLHPGGRLLFTDTAVLTGAIAKAELDMRASIGAFLLVPPGLDEEAIRAAGLALLCRDDRTSATRVG